MTSHLKDMCRYKRYLHHQAKVSNSSVIWAIYKKYRNRVKHAISQAKTEHLSSYLNEGNSKSLWAKVKRFAGFEKVSQSENIVLDTEEGLITDSVSIANCFNSFFKHKVKRLQSKLDPAPNLVREYVREFLAGKSLTGFSLATVTTKEICNIINSLNSTSALGYDNIATACIKKFKYTLAPYICYVVNQMIFQSEFPQLFKTGIICPVPKKGNLRLVSNYRPVQLNSPLSKIAETVINNQLKLYLEQHGLLPKTQNSYRKGFSTFSALADVNTIINDARSRAKQCMILATDMSSAFNLVHKDILDTILEEYEIDCLSRKLIKDYMTGRRVSVRIKNEMSDWEYLETGVGEGTIVGPLFFILILSPLSSVIARVKEKVISESYDSVGAISQEMFDVTSREYADDVSGILWADNDEVLQIVATETMSQFKLFFSAIGMALNPDKTEILCIRSSPKTKNITVEGQGESSSLRLLGLHMDHNFSYELHIAQLKKNISFKLCCLRRLAPFLSQSNMKKITEALVHSSVMYCLPLFGHEVKFQRVIQKLINSAARIVLRRGFRESATEMMKELQWLNCRNLYFLESICWLSRIIETKSAYFTFTTILNGFKRKQHVHNTKDSSIHVDLDYSSKYIRQSFV